MKKNHTKYIIIISITAAVIITAFIAYIAYFKEPDKNFQSIDQILQMHGGIDLQVVEPPKTQGPFHVLSRTSTQEGKTLSGYYGDEKYAIEPISGYQVGLLILENKGGETEMMVVKFK